MRRSVVRDSVCTVVCCTGFVSAAAGDVVYSVDFGGPSGLVPDLLYTTPGVVLSPPISVGGGLGMGLGRPGDNLNGLASNEVEDVWVFCWSVDEFAMGLPLVAAARTSLGLPTFDMFHQSLRDQQAADGFVTTEAWDVNGILPPPISLGVFENILAINQGGVYFQTYCLLPDIDPPVFNFVGNAQDNIDAETRVPDAQNLPPLYYTLTPRSTSLQFLPAGPVGSGCDIFYDNNPTNPGSESLFADGPALGLIEPSGVFQGDDIDALIVRDVNANGLFEEGTAAAADEGPGPGGDWVIFSLSPGSPTLTLLGASPGDLILRRNGTLTVLAQASQMGVAPNDNIDAVDGISLVNMSVQDTLDAIFPEAEVCQGDLSGDDVVDLVDVNIVLGSFGVSAAGDADGDGQTGLSDLNLVLTWFGSVCGQSAEE